MDQAPAALLIGGTSHVGKSTLARHLALRNNWAAASTDQLARHPGRPWVTDTKSVPPHVVEHYRELSPDALMDSVLAHYASMLPTIIEYITGQFREFPSSYLALEGSALTPANLHHMRLPNVSAIFLTAEGAVIKERIRIESGYQFLENPEKRLVDKFTVRALRFNDLIAHDATRYKWPLIHIADETNLDDLADQCIRRAVQLSF